MGIIYFSPYSPFPSFDASIGKDVVLKTEIIFLGPTLGELLLLSLTGFMLAVALITVGEFVWWLRAGARSSLFPTAAWWLVPLLFCFDSFSAVACLAEVTGKVTAVPPSLGDLLLTYLAIKRTFSAGASTFILNELFIAVCIISCYWILSAFFFDTSIWSVTPFSPSGCMGDLLCSRCIWV